MRISLIALLFVCMLFTHCSVKKRAYKNGYYISWNHKSSNVPASQHRNDPGLVHSSKPAVHEPGSEVPAEVIASENKDLPTPAIEKPKLTVFNNKDECGDIITFRKGSEVKAKVIEINETQIKYKRCDNLDGPLMVANKNDVFSVKYANGLLEHFNKTEDYLSTLSNKKPTKPQEVHPLAYVTLGLTIAICFLSIAALAAALIVGHIARRKILEQPGRYGGLQMVNICLAICWALLILTAIVIVMLFMALTI